MVRGRGELCRVTLRIIPPSNNVDRGKEPYRQRLRTEIQAEEEISYIRECGDIGTRGARDTGRGRDKKGHKTRNIHIVRHAYIKTCLELET